MKRSPDPRLDATRSEALDAALQLLLEKGVLAVTHSAINRETGISRSTLYRHWAKLEDLRYAVFAHAATSPDWQPQTTGPLKTDLLWIIGHLVKALNETTWGEVAPHLIATAANEEQTRNLLRRWIEDRSGNVEEVFGLAMARGELRKDAPVSQLVEMSIAIPYFRKLIEGLPLDHKWLNDHVDMICSLAMDGKKD